MAKLIRSATVAADNWASRTSGQASFYKSQADAAQWKANAASVEAEKNFNDSMTNVLSKKLRQAGVNASSDEAYHAGIDAVGESRFSDGVNKSKPRMLATMNKLIPALDTIRKGLKPRGVRGSQANKDRFNAFFDGLHAQAGSFKSKGVSRSAS